MANSVIQNRPEIDGLRALAVLPVIFYHAGLPGLPGGFLGVDIFFVISGFLISRIIIKDLNRNSFSLANFYERRARRILPALYLVCFFSVAASLIFMPPILLDDFFYSLASVSLFASNIFFYFKTDYFATAAELRPLLHTWSLSIEEQFYLLFPLFCLAFYKQRKMFFWTVLFLVFLTSLLSTSYMATTDGAGNFYLILTRAWELLVGSLAAFLYPLFQRLSAIKRELLSFFGLTLIGLSIYLFNDQMLLPGYLSLVPTGGTFLLLTSCSVSLISGRLLSVSPLVWTGLISYSLYLWHNPILAYANLLNIEKNDLIFQLFFIFGLFLISFLSWQFVEQPFRDMKLFSRKAIFQMVTVCTIALLAPALYSYSVGFNSLYLSSAGNEFLNSYNARERAVKYYREDCNFYLNNQIKSDCLEQAGFSRSPNLPETLVWGDSHAQALAAGLRRVYGHKHFFAQLATSACRPRVLDINPQSLPSYPTNNRAFAEACKKANATATQYIRKSQPDTVLIHFSKLFGSIDWDRIIKYLETNGVRRLIVVGPVPQWSPSTPYVHAMQIDTKLPKNLRSYLREHVIEDHRFLSDHKITSKIIEISLILPTKFLCNEYMSCSYVVPSAPATDFLLTYDYGHLGFAGSNYLANTLFTKLF